MPPGNWTRPTIRSAHLGPKAPQKEDGRYGTAAKLLWRPRWTPLEAYWELREWITGPLAAELDLERNPISPAGKRKPPVHPSVIRAKDIPRDRHWRADRILEEPDRIKVVAGLRDHGHGPVDKCIKEGPDYIDAARFLNELLVGNKHHDNGPDKRQEWSGAAPTNMSKTGAPSLAICHQCRITSAPLPAIRYRLAPPYRLPPPARLVFLA